MKITVIIRNKFPDFNNRPLNLVPLNTGLNVIGILKNLHTIENQLFRSEIEQKFNLCGQICYLIN